MTTIKSVFEHSPWNLTVEPGSREGETYLRVNQGKNPFGDAMVSTADLAAALGLVTREEVEEARATTRAAWERASNDIEAERDALRAELDEAKATIERAREATAIWGDRFRPAILAALDPKPASKQVILTADMAGVKVNGYDFTKGVIVTLPTADADRLISAGLAKEAGS